LTQGESRIRIREMSDTSAEAAQPGSPPIEARPGPVESERKPPGQQGNRLGTGIVRSVIATDLNNGLTPDQIALKYGIHRNSAYYHVRKIHEQQMKERDSDPRSWLRVKLEKPAVTAVLRGVKCKEDVYKAANIGVQVLRGLGLFEGDGSQVVNVQVQQAEDPVVARYLAIHGRYPTESEKLALAAKPVNGERIEEKEQV